MQSKKHSLIESLTNTVIGYIVAVASQMAIFPLFNIHIEIQDNLLIGVWFTVISLTRGYLVRRWFARRTDADEPTPEWQCVTGLGADCCCQRKASL